MEKMKKIKNMCELEKYVGEMAHKKLMFCKGFYLSTGVPFYDDYFGCKPCAECKECKRYLYRRQYMNLFYAVAIVFGILMMLILGTPQGAIRWNLFFHEGVQEALYSNVERILESKKFYQKNNSSIWIYGIFKLPHLRKIQTPRKELFHV